MASASSHMLKDQLISKVENPVLMSNANMSAPGYRNLKCGKSSLPES